MRWILPLLAVVFLVSSVIVAAQGRFGVAMAIGVVAACCLQLDRMRGRLR